MKTRTHFLLFAAACVAILLLAGCGQKEQRALSTGVVIPGAQLPIQGYRGDNNYSVVQSSALPEIYKNFRDVLFRQGMTRWDERFDCNHFASLYISLTQARFAAVSWMSSTKADTLAMAEFWYTRDKDHAKHAIVAIVTERGLIFVEPQNGEEVKLSENERTNGVALCKW